MSNWSDDSSQFPEELTEPGSRILPLFPLPDLILFPGQLVPVHIFEPRYRKMAEDLLDNTGEIIIGTVLGEDQEQLVKLHRSRASRASAGFSVTRPSMMEGFF